MLSLAFPHRAHKTITTVLWSRNKSNANLKTRRAKPIEYEPRYKKSTPTHQPQYQPTPTQNRISPWVELKYVRSHPCLYPNTISSVSPTAHPGSIVNVYAPTGHLFGAALYNPPPARVTLRMIHYGEDVFTEAHFLGILERALAWRKTMQFEEGDDAYRVINSDGDGLSGLIVDRFNDVLSIKVHSLGIWNRLNQIIQYLHNSLGTSRCVIEVEDFVVKIEGIQKELITTHKIEKVCVTENNLKYEVDFLKGHKTGFFCDQRVNRLKVGLFCRDKDVLDLCCYTGGFSLNALRSGAASVTSVDLDPTALLQARRNLRLNRNTLSSSSPRKFGSNIHFVEEDAFSFGRNMIKEGRRWDVVICDPPKFISARGTKDQDGEGDGKMEQNPGVNKYFDLNAIAMRLVKPGGVLVTCSCSGLMSREGFIEVLNRAAESIGKRLQIFEITGAAGDHPVMTNCPEGEYLKVVWARVF